MERPLSENFRPTALLSSLKVFEHIILEENQSYLVDQIRPEQYAFYQKPFNFNLSNLQTSLVLITTTNYNQLLYSKIRIKRLIECGTSASSIIYSQWIFLFLL